MKALCGEDNCDTWSQALRDIVMTTSQQHVTATAIYIHANANSYLTTNFLFLQDLRTHL
jgi:hypothetical protein